MMTIPDVEISAVPDSQRGFNLFARWHQHLRFKRWEVVKRLKVVKSRFYHGHFLFTCSDTFAVGCVV